VDEDSPIYRAEVAALLQRRRTSSSRSTTSSFCREAVPMAKKGKLTKADYERHERMLGNATRPRELAEKAQAEVERRKAEQAKQ
jgi:hypothetical protein